AVAAEPLEHAGAREEELPVAGRGLDDLAALPRHLGEPAREVLAGRRDELALARGDFLPELEALQLLGERRLVLLAVGELRLERPDAALQAGEVGRRRRVDGRDRSPREERQRGGEEDRGERTPRKRSRGAPHQNDFPAASTAGAPPTSARIDAVTSAM